MLLRTLLRRAVGLFTLVGAWAGVHAAPCPPPPAMPTAAQLQAAQTQDRGLLWRLRRDGRTSWLYGTLHVGKLEWMAPGPRVAAALAGSPVLALELDPTDAGMQQALAAPDERPLTLSPALSARLARWVDAACLPAGAIAHLHPMLQTVVLSLLEARWIGLDPSFAQEQALAQAARSAGRRIVSLETVALQKQALVPADAAAALLMVDQTLAQLESGTGRQILLRLARAWEQGDLGTLENYPAWCDCMRNDDERAAMRALNDDRNPALAARIEALHHEGKPVFAAVGALHMTGPAALPRLLAARGFTVEQVVP